MKTQLEHADDKAPVSQALLLLEQALAIIDEHFDHDVLGAKLSECVELARAQLSANDAHASGSN